jgi:hypothetical protein
VAGLLDQGGTEGGVQLRPPRDVDLCRRSGGVDDLRKRHVDACRLEGAPELDGAIGERAGWSSGAGVPDRGKVPEQVAPDKT